MVEIMDSVTRRKLTQDITSDIPERIATALEFLDQASSQRIFGPLNMPEPSCLESFGPTVPTSVLSCYIRVLQNYTDFEPTPSISDIRHALVEAIIYYGQGHETLEVALFLQADSFPKSAVIDALRYIEELELSNSAQIFAAQKLIDHLLDSAKTREATISILKIWVDTDNLQDIVNHTRERLNEEEISKLQVSNIDY